MICWTATIEIHLLKHRLPAHSCYYVVVRKVSGASAMILLLPDETDFRFHASTTNTHTQSKLTSSRHSEQVHFLH